MEEQGLLSYVKKIIHSLVVSEPTRMTVEKLKRDYAKEEGTAIPFIKLGFRDIENFLHSISDTITVLGNGPMAEVLAKTNPKSAHIQHLVQCQKKPSSRPRTRNGSRFRHPAERSNLVFMNNHVHDNNRRLNNNNQYQNNNYNNNYIAYNGSNHIYNQQSARVNQRAASPQQNMSAAQTSSMINSFANFQIRSVDDDSSSDDQSDFKIYVPEKESLPEMTDKNKEMAVETQSYIVYVSSEESSDEDAIPLYALDDQILNYKQDKDAQNVDLGQVNTYKVPSVEQHKSDEAVVNNCYSSDEGADDDAIPISAVDENVMSVDYPTNTVRFDHKLPCRDFRQKLKLENREEVQLVSISSPHSFYFWLHDEELEKYKAMSINMQHFYTSIEVTKFNIPLYLIMIGHLGAVHFNNTIWHRVQVSNIKTGDRKNIEVELVDTGERIWISHTDLKFLSREFATLPPQCWRGRLAYVAPRHGPNFSAHASNYFFELVCFRKVFTKFEKINEEDNTAYMILVDPEAESYAKNINLALIDSGNVRRCFIP